MMCHRDWCWIYFPFVIYNYLNENVGGMVNMFADDTKIGGIVTAI